MFRLSDTHELHTKWLYDVRPLVLECEEVFRVSIERYARTAYEVAARLGVLGRGCEGVFVFGLSDTHELHTVVCTVL